MVFLSSTRLFFSAFDKFWVNNGRTVLQQLHLSVTFFSVKIFKIRFLSVFQEFFFGCVVFLLVSVLCFKNIFFNLDLIMMALGSSFDMKGASLALMYFFFIRTWRLNILKIVLLYIPKLSTLDVAVNISYLNLALSKFL